MATSGSLLALMGDGPGIGGGIARYNSDWLRAQCQGEAPIHAVFRQAREPGDLLNGGEHVIAHSRLRFVRAAWRLAARLRPATIFCGHLHYAPLAAWLCKRYGAQLWLQLHGVEAWPIPSQTRRRSAEAATQVSCVSRYTRMRFLSWARIAPERVRVLPNTVGDEFVADDDEGASRTAHLEQALTQRGRPRLLTVGRLSASERYKGHDLVIACLPALRAQLPQIQYLIAGDGDDRARLQALADGLGVSAQVQFLGHVAHADLPALYRLADLYIMPSSGEGFGIVYLEAMCSGTQALGLAGDGSADPLADGELGILAATPNDLTDAVLRALASAPERSILAQRTRARFSFAHFQTLAQLLSRRAQHR